VSSACGHDATLCTVNRRFVAVIVESSGGGVFVVLPLHMVRLLHKSSLGDYFEL